MKNSTEFKLKTIMEEILGFVICCLVGLMFFYFFVKCVDWFEHI